MKVLHLISSAGQYGAENMLLTLAAAGKECDCESVVGVFDNLHRPNTDILCSAAAKGLPSERFVCDGRFDRAVIGKIRKCIRRHGVDLVHAHGFKANFYAYWAARRARTPLVSTCHNYPGKTLALRLYYSIDRKILRRFDHVVAVSNPVAQILRKSGLQPNRISVIENGIDTTRFRPRQLPHDHLELPASLRVGSVGRLAPVKGLDHLLRAARRVLDVLPQTEFVLAGDGPERDSLQRLARELDIQDSVTFLGSRPDMENVFSTLDVFVLSSLNEGTPLSLLEAMACRLPVLATQVGEIPRIIHSGRHGLLVPPGDAALLASSLIDLLSDAKLRDRLADAARARVQSEFSAEIMARRYFEIYASVCKPSAQSQSCAEALS